ncbi:MAG TPA: saccharopine dehydrogenase NADP-binding domain-containing protein [Actinomycetota bacterium]|nr:saccharopine dehydrogenase NADP-binding domain-containing protein [Actinomycetota bacterium]
MNVLLLGASGAVGRRTAAELVRSPEVDRMTLAGRDRAILQALVDRLRGRAALALESFDILDPGLADRMSGHDVVVSCAGPGTELEVPCVDAAIQAGVSYLSLNDDLEPLGDVAARDAEAKVAGVTVVSGCGAAPGISNLLMTLAATELDSVDEVEVAFAASSADAGGPAGDLHFLAMLDRAARERDFGDGARAPHPVYFPEPVGWVETFGCGHPEAMAAFRSRPDLSAFSFRIGLGEKAVMDAVRAAIASRITTGDRSRRIWLKAANPLRPLLEKVSPGAGAWTALRTDVRGRSAGKTRTISLGVVDHLVNLASIPLAQAALSWSSVGPGVFTPDQAFPAKPFLRAVAGRGIRFARLEPHAL